MVELEAEVDIPPENSGFEGMGKRAEERGGLTRAVDERR